MEHDHVAKLLQTITARHLRHIHQAPEQDRADSSSTHQLQRPFYVPDRAGCGSAVQASRRFSGITSRKWKSKQVVEFAIYSPKISFTLLIYKEFLNGTFCVKWPETPNRTEKRHGLARAICHGRRGEIRKRYREGQEDQLGALGLITNAAVLWNTIYLQDALDLLQQQPTMSVIDEDVARLSPLRHQHINMLGHYTFTLAEHIRQGEHRPLNQLEAAFGEDLESLLATLDHGPES